MNWLIHLLKGITKEEHNLLNIEYLQQRDLVTDYRAREDRLLKELELERSERKELQQIIFKNFGVVFNDESKPFTQADYDQLKPISNGPQRWSNVKNRMEKDDRARANAEK
jgi:hypothetical protein